MAEEQKTPEVDIDTDGVNEQTIELDQKPKDPDPACGLPNAAHVPDWLFFPGLAVRSLSGRGPALYGSARPG